MKTVTFIGAGVVLKDIPVYDIEAIMKDDTWVKCPECGEARAVETAEVLVSLAGMYRDTTLELHICTECKVSWFVLGTGERE